MIRPRTHRRRPHAGAVLFALAFAAGCATQPVQQPRSTDPMAGVAPMLSVERFLQAANARDLEAMMRLFGTHEGPIRGDRRELELRMSAIAEVLRHDDYRVTGQRDEPGRMHPTTRVAVTLTRGQRVVPEVPFLVVRTRDGQWLVEEIDLEKITGT